MGSKTRFAWSRANLQQAQIDYQNAVAAVDYATDPYLRTLLVQGAQHILGPFGVDSDLRRREMKLAERGGRNGKKRAIVATARKLAVLLHHLWVSREVYEPLRNSTQIGMQ